MIKPCDDKSEQKSLVISFTLISGPPGRRNRSKRSSGKGEQQRRAENEREKRRRSEGELEEKEEKEERRRSRRGEAWADRGASAAVSWTGSRCSETGGSRIVRLTDAFMRWKIIYLVLFPFFCN